MKEITPRVSVIVPVFRAETTLADTLNSLLAQDEWRWEALVVDDGSPDDSWRVADRFCRNDGRFRLLRQPNAGACAARNAGLAEARGTYALFLDSDDWLERGALTSLTGACDYNRWSAVHGGFAYTLPDGTPTGWTGGSAGNLPLFEALADSNVLALPSSVLLRRSLIGQVGGFDPSLAHCGDWDLWARIARSSARVGRIDQCVTSYRMRPSSLSRNPSTLLRDATEVFRRIHSADPRVKRADRRWVAGADASRLRKRVAVFTLYAAGASLASGNGAEAQALVRSVKSWPALCPTRTAGFLLYAICFARCRAPSEAGSFWAGIEPSLRDLLAQVNAANGLPDFADRVISAMSELSCGAVPHPAEAPGIEPSFIRNSTDTMALEYLRGLARSEGRRAVAAAG